MSKKRNYHEKSINRIVIPNSVAKEAQRSEQKKYGAVELVSTATASHITFQMLGAEDHMGLVRLFDLARITHAQELRAFQEGKPTTVKKQVSLRHIRKGDRPFIYEFTRTQKGLVMYTRKPVKKNTKSFWCRVSTALPAFGYAKSGINCDTISKLLHLDVRVNYMNLLRQYRNMELCDFLNKYHHADRQQREATLNQNPELFPDSNISIVDAAKAGAPQVPQPFTKETAESATPVPAS